VFLAIVAAAAVNAAALHPIREVVYHVSYVRHSSSTAGAGVADHGTVTVDVMAVSNNALGLKVTERWSKNPTSLVALGTVQPKGNLVFAPGALSDVTDQLLPYFAPLFVPQQPLLTGVTWTAKDDQKDLTANTVYSVTSVQGTSVIVGVKQSIAVRDATHAQIASNGSVVYEPRLLVPLSGDFTKHLTARVGGAIHSITHTLHFARSSDTREPG
jgi:hypothetical protein